MQPARAAISEVSALAGCTFAPTQVTFLLCKTSDISTWLQHSSKTTVRPITASFSDERGGSPVKHAEGARLRASPAQRGAGLDRAGGGSPPDRAFNSLDPSIRAKLTATSAAARDRVNRPMRLRVHPARAGAGSCVKGQAACAVDSRLSTPVTDPPRRGRASPCAGPTVADPAPGPERRRGTLARLCATSSRAAVAGRGTAAVPAALPVLWRRPGQGVPLPAVLRGYPVPQLHPV